MGHIILCHAYEDKREVQRIADVLHASGFEPWADSEELFDGHESEEDVANLLRETECMLVFLSKNSVRKIDSVSSDFGQILGVWKDMPEGSVFTLPLRINDCNVPDLFKSFHHYDLFENNGLESVISRLQEERAKQRHSDPSLDAQGASSVRTEDGSDEATGGFHVAGYDRMGEFVEGPEILSEVLKAGAQGK